MAALAVVNSATPSLQSSLIRARVDAARREADQAESYAKALRGQAQEQERVMVQARARAQGLEKDASQNSNAAPPPAAAKVTTSATESSPPTTAQPSARTVVLQQKSTYTGVLAGMFEAAKPILKVNLSAPQKNLVQSSLLQAANQVWSANPTPSKVAVTYGVRVNQTLTGTSGQLLNTLA